MRTDSLFVYGPWAPGQPLFWRLEPLVLRQQPATVRGSLYRSQLGFPLFVNEGRDQIRGMRLELSQFFSARRTLPIDCVVENTVQATKIFAYLPGQIPHPRVRIAYGDWERDQKQRPSHLHQLSRLERECLLRLSTDSGEYPDPGVYLQLLKLGLLKDQGAGWGLSRLGRAAANYLEEATCPISH